MPSLDPRLVAILVLSGILLVVLLVVLPLVGRLSLIVEAITLLSEPLGDLFGNQRIVLLGCIVLFLTIAACCIITFVIVGSLLSLLFGSIALSVFFFWYVATHLQFVI